MSFHKYCPLEKTKYGYYRHSPLPTKEELQEWYSKEYYQQGIGGYEVFYSPEETRYFKLKAELIYKEISRLRDPKIEKYVLDIGCGEGWALDQFFQGGHKVAAIDFSEFGLKAFHQHLLPFLEQGDCVELIQQKIIKNQKHDVVILLNVIEHVLDPVELLEKIKDILAPQGILVITAPNDFSPLHQHLMDQRIIDKEFWLAYPEHITYFNKDSMQKLLDSKGFNIKAVVADNPIDLNLLNKNSNYIREPEKSKNIHSYRVQADNFLASISKDKLLDLYEVLGSMGVGRNLTYFCST